MLQPLTLNPHALSDNLEPQPPQSLDSQILTKPRFRFWGFTVSEALAEVGHERGEVASTQRTVVDSLVELRFFRSRVPASGLEEFTGFRV